MSAFELARCFSKPIATKPIDNLIHDDVLNARDQFQARHKLALILSSKAVTEVPLPPGDLVEVYQKRDHEKRGKWSAPKSVTSVNHEARSVTVPCKNGRTINAAFEDTRTAVRQDSFAQMVQNSMDSMTKIIHEQSAGTVAASDSIADRHNRFPKTLEIGNNTPASSSETDAADADLSINSSNVVPNVGDRVSVF